MKKTKYRKNNYQASERRTSQGLYVHPILLEGIKRIAKDERRSICWVVETALADYFGIEILLRKYKSKPLPAYRQRYER